MRTSHRSGQTLPRRAQIVLKHATTCASLALAASWLPGCSALGPAPPDWSWSNPFSEPATVGTAEWWKKNKRRAQFEPDKGYKVAGVEGYFDQNGRPIDRPVERTVLTEKPEGLMPDLDPLISYRKMKSAVGLGPNQQAAKEFFAKAEKHFAAERYAKARNHYRDAAQGWPKSPLEENSLFMVAECDFFGNRYARARDGYNELAEKYPSTRHLNTLVERQWDIAQYWEREYFDSWKIPLSPNPYDKTRPRFDTIGHAIKTYENIRMNDPTGPRADDAIMAQAGIYFRRERYDDADYHYTLLRTEYPRSEFQFEAHLLGLQAKLHKYQGPDYDGSALDEAKGLAKQLKTQFAGRLSDEEFERLRIVEAELNLQVAQRDARMAQYYDDKKRFAAARYYYGQLIERHPDSELANLARERIAEIRDEPDNPPKRLAWLVDLFPESRERARVARIPELQDKLRK